MKDTVKILSVLEGNKFSANNDMSVLSTAADLIYSRNKNIWSRGTAERAKLLEMLAGKLALSTEAYHSSTGLDSLVMFVQGLLLISLSLVNGLGRSPIGIQRKEDEIMIRVIQKALMLKLTVGKYDSETARLVREFKTVFYGKALDESFAKNELLVIKEALRETNERLKREKQFIDKVAKDPMLIFNKASETTFSTGLFLVLSALPTETLNMLMMDIGAYLPAELEEVNDDSFTVNVRNYLTNSTADIHELFKKVRVLLKLYFGRQREIVGIIVRDKTRDNFKKLLESGSIKKEVQRHLQETAEDQFQLRIKILDGLIKLL